MGLTEAASLSDQFVLRLMFRLYRLPITNGGPGTATAETLLAQHCLLDSFASWKKSIRLRTGGKPIEHTQYLVLSAMPLDIPLGTCSALVDRRCSIYDRRPLSCRTVPLHYSRADPLTASALSQFVSTPGYRCETGADAPVLLRDGGIVREEFVTARAGAVSAAGADRDWGRAIVKQIKTSSNITLPSLRDIEANYARGALTTSMRMAWMIAVDAGLMAVPQFRQLIANQLGVIARELILARATPDDLVTLTEMQYEYRHYLQDSDC